MPLDIHEYEDEEYRAHHLSPKRMIVLPWFVWALAIGLAVGGVLYAAKVKAADTFRYSEDGKDKVVLVLRDSPCTDPAVLEYLHDNVLDDRRFKKGELEWEGKPFGACWVEINGMVIPIGSDKEPIRPMPRRAFKDEAI